MSTDTEHLVSTENARRPGSDVYKKVIEQIKDDGVCPFCPDQLDKYHKKPILKEGKCWKVTFNMYPYENAKYHFLLILQRHASDTKQLSPEEWSELYEHVNWLVDTYEIPGGTFFMRCGDMAHTGATVRHLHAQFVSPDYSISNADRKPILARVG